LVGAAGSKETMVRAWPGAMEAPGGKAKVDAAGDLPVGQGFRRGSGVEDFDEFEMEVVGAGGGVVVDFAEDDAADAGAAVGGAEGAGDHGDEASGAVGPAAEGFAVEGGAEFDAVDEADEAALGIGFEEIDVFAVGAVEGEVVGIDTHGGIEVVGFVEGDVASGGQDGAGWDGVLAVVGLGIAEIPAADVDGLPGGVEEFDGIGEGRIGMGEDFVDDDAVVGAGAGGAGRAAVFGTGAPGGGGGVVGVGGVDQFQGGAVAVGAAGPGAAVGIGDRGDDAALGIFEADGFAAVGELAGVGADDADGGVGVAGAEGVGVAHDDGVVAVGEGEGGEGGGDAVLEHEPGDSHRGIAGVEKFDELESRRDR
jgi:hypothetical protein